MSITKLKPIGGWAAQYADPTHVGTFVRPAVPATTKPPRILIGLLTGGDDPLPPKPTTRRG